MFHYMRWLDDRLETEKLSEAQRADILRIAGPLSECYAEWLPSTADVRWAEKYCSRLENQPTSEEVFVLVQSLADALRSIPDEEREAFLSLCRKVWSVAVDAADDPLWLIEFSGSQLIELNYFHRLVVLAQHYVAGQMSEAEFKDATFSYAQRPLRRDHYFLNDNSMETYRRALETLNFRMSSTLLLIFRDFMDHLEAIPTDTRMSYRSESKKNLTPEGYEYVQSTLRNVKALVDKDRELHPGDSKKRFNDLRYVINFPATLNALRKRCIYGHSLQYAFPFATTLQVLYHCAEKIDIEQDSIFFDFSRLILNYDADRIYRKKPVEQPAFEGTTSIDPLKLN